MSNAVAVLRELDKQCPGSERHVQLMSGRAKDAAIYPKGLCRAVCRGVQRQLDADMRDLMVLAFEGELDDVELHEVAEQRTEEDESQWLRY